ncbi:integrin alpha-L isoform X2 [Mixophyes fleayi]|uniref:integrin alpha-L isoform X2 n=1 Tax=Mixophyes fleayi TaxID=3061075 RepID=UPI003F4DD5E9
MLSLFYCQKAIVDLCFLFDVSGSVGISELNSVRQFLHNTIQSLKDTSVHFAVVQFSHIIKTVFNFNQYQQFGNLTKIIEQMNLLGGPSSTYEAIMYTLNNIFTERAGSRPKAKKVLLFLSSGEVDDPVNNAIEKAENLGVKRYIIGLAKNLGNKEAQQNIEALASKPTSKYWEKLDESSRLVNLLEDIQQKILSIEGVAQGSSFSRELSSAGLSADLMQGRRMLGDPGIFDWSGGILDISSQEILMNMSLPDEYKYGYLGYSVRLFNTSEGLFCVAGAPRFQYLGLVTILRENPDGVGWEKIDSLQGEQVGSYFGSEIEVSDLDNDNHSDLVLISAPHYYDIKRSGQVYVYSFEQGKPVHQVTLYGEPGHLHSQFGATVSTLGDLDGDGFNEIAVGAPYEMDGRGALYIYKGESAGLSVTYNQRIPGTPGTRGFGLSIHGVMDMTQDGLTDIVVGSWGHVSLHRSRPLLRVHVNVSISPSNIPIPTLEVSSCNSEVTLQACVTPEILTSQYTGPLDAVMQYTLILDSQRPVSRMFFRNNQRQINKNITIQSQSHVCQDYTVHLQDCSLEDVSPVEMSLTLYPIQDTSEWLLSPTSSLNDSTKIPFQICGSGGSCQPDLHIHILEHSLLVVRDGAWFSVTIRLQNSGEGAHQVKLSVACPAGLTFRKANVTQTSRQLSLKCEEFKAQILTCNVSHPILRRAVRADIQVMFGIVHNVSWPDQVLLAVNVTSNNNGNETLNNAEKEIPVLYPINIITRSLGNSTKYVEFINQDEKSFVSHEYQIQNLGASSVPILVTLSINTSSALSKGLTWDFTMTNEGSHVRCSVLETGYTQGALTNKTWECSMGSLTMMDISISGLLKPTQAWKVKTSEIVDSLVTIRYNQSRFHSDMGHTFHTVKVETQVELLVPPNHVLFIAGGSVGGVVFLLLLSLLLYKCGFFKRYKDRMAESAPHSDPQPLGRETGQDAEEPGPQEALTAESL